MLPTLLFDMDGTLVDTEQLHFAAFRTILEPHGVSLDWAGYRQFIMGHPNHAIAAHYLPHVPQELHAGLMHDKEAQYRAMVKDVSPAEGLMELLDWADAPGSTTAVVTNAPRANAELVLEASEDPPSLQGGGGGRRDRPSEAPSHALPDGAGADRRRRRLGRSLSRIPARAWRPPWRRACRSSASRRPSMRRV